MKMFNARKAGSAGAVQVLVTLATITSDWGGALDPPASPTSTMVTLDEINAAAVSAEAAATATAASLEGLVTAIGSAEIAAQGAALAAEAAADPRTPISSFPFSITEPGSYYLTRGFNGTFLALPAISLSTGHVTIDLNGFALDASNFGAQPPQGINIGGNTNVTIRNGTVRGFTNGVLANSGTNITLESLQLIDNLQSGAGVTGPARFIACRANGNGTDGLRGGGDSVVLNCTAGSNGGDGISVRFRSLVQGCRSDFNGADGISTEGESLIIGNACSRNGNGGDGAGIHITGNGTRIEENLVILNDRGIDVDNDGNIVTKNSAHDNGNASGVNDYAITGVQTIGEIITATGTIGSAVSPWANFSF
jgi:hypothetical protein